MIKTFAWKYCWHTLKKRLKQNQLHFHVSITKAICFAELSMIQLLTKNVKQHMRLNMKLSMKLNVKLSMTQNAR